MTKLFYKLPKLFYKLPKFLFKKIKQKFWTWRVRRQCESVAGKLTVNNKSTLNRHCKLGANVNFNGMQISGDGRVVIGDNFHSGPECLMITQNHNFDTGKSIPYDETYITKDIYIGNNVWIGSRVIILGGISIGEGAIIQAGSCVVSNIPPYAIAGGHPAKVFSNRNIEHYEKLKIERKFL